MKLHGPDGRFVNTREKQNCGVCGAEVLAPRKYCSYKCYGVAQQGCRHPTNYRAARTVLNGYVWIRPDPKRKRAVQEHRWVMEQYLGRKLDKSEVVHHKNHDPSDNRLENLELLPNHSAHMKQHHNKHLTNRKKDRSIDHTAVETTERAAETAILENNQLCRRCH